MFLTPCQSVRQNKLRTSPRNRLPNRATRPTSISVHLGLRCVLRSTSLCDEPASRALFRYDTLAIGSDDCQP